MNSSFESLSTQLLFEFFDYLSPFDLFRIFINFNSHVSVIVHSYPFRLDFRPICRSKFDSIYRYLQPKQVISLNLCDERVPDRSVALIEAETITFIDLPLSVSLLSIRSYDVNDYYPNYINEILSRQAKVLTHLKNDSKDLQHLIDFRFSALKYLIIGGECYYDGKYIDVSSPLENINVH
ncbi:unnamed protein product [Rotaria sp. Silwood2]|nr:unnamed protein product [Rotaria sp. Silwood2]